MKDAWLEMCQYLLKGYANRDKLIVSQSLPDPVFIFSWGSFLDPWSCQHEREKESIRGADPEE